MGVLLDVSLMRATGCFDLSTKFPKLAVRAELRDEGKLYDLIGPSPLIVVKLLLNFAIVKASFTCNL